jgi:hypothetical protein
VGRAIGLQAALLAAAVLLAGCSREGGSTPGSAPGRAPAAAAGPWLGEPPVPWPPALVAVAARARASARQWQADAQLVGIRAELLAPGAPPDHFLESTAGHVALELVFRSEAAGQRRLRIAPGDPEVEVSELPPADDGQPIPDDFLDLPAAAAEARERGMRSGAPRVAELRDWGETYRAGTRLSGLGWSLAGGSGVDEAVYFVPLQVFADGGARQVDACALLTPQDAAQLLGAAAGPGAAEQRGSVWSCSYGAGEARLRLRVDEDPARDRVAFFHAHRRGLRDAVELSGVGDGAYASDSAQGVSELKVLLGDTLLEISVGLPGRGDRVQAGAGLARRAVERLIRGEGTRELPSPHLRLVGDWRAEREGTRLLLRVQPRGALSIWAATTQIGVVSCQGSSWSLISRARRRLVGGTWRLEGSALVTGGPLAARWTRLAPGQAPAQIDPALLAGRPPPPGSEAWPVAAVDSGLEGVWQARSGDTDWVWQLRADGPSELTRVERVRGYVELFNGQAVLHLPAALGGPSAHAHIVDDDHFEMTTFDAATVIWTRAGAAPAAPGSDAGA